MCTSSIGYSPSLLLANDGGGAWSSYWRVEAKAIEAQSVFTAAEQSGGAIFVDGFSKTKWRS